MGRRYDNYVVLRVHRGAGCSCAPGGNGADGRPGLDGIDGRAGGTAVMALMDSRVATAFDGQQVLLATTLTRMPIVMGFLIGLRFL